MSEKVSVIIPTYKRSDSLCNAINSIINQSYNNYEIIVVDDNDPDSEYRKATESRMKRYEDNDKVIYLKHPENLKGSAARNTGIKASQGDYITFLDDDDIIEPTKLEKQVNRLKEMGEEYGAVCCGVEIRDESNGKLMRVVQPQKEGFVHFDFLKMRYGMGTGSNAMYTRKAVEETGFFDTSFLRRQDIEYAIRVQRKFKMAVVTEVLVTKYESGHPNRPDINKMLEIEEHFLNTFENDIKQYSEVEQNEIYRNNYHQNCIAAIDVRAWKIAKENYKKAKSYMKYTLRMRMGMIRHILNNKY